MSLEQPAFGGVRVQVRLDPGSRALLALPRLVLLACGVAALLQAFRQRVFIGFWFFGVPFVPWLLGPKHSSLLLGERALEVESVRSLGGALVLPRSRITRIEIARAGPLHGFQRALYAHTVNGQTVRLLVGSNAGQAEFVNDGLQRWLAAEG